MAFGISAIITNGLLYKKPQDVEATRRILASRRPQSSEELRAIAFEGPGYFFYHSENARTGIPNNSIHKLSDSDPFSPGLQQNFGLKALMKIIALGGGVFGDIHCIAWNFTFPTSEEQTIWRIMSLISIAVIVFLGITNAFPVFLKMFSESYLPFRWLGIDPLTQPTFVRKLYILVARYFIIVEDYGYLSWYILARLYLTVEMFRALAFAPPGTFIETFTASIPTVG